MSHGGVWKKGGGARWLEMEKGGMKEGMGKGEEGRYQG